MKYLAILMLLGGSILGACRAEAENLVTKLDKGPTEITTLFSPTPTPLPTPKPTPIFDIHAKIGIADLRSDGTGCLRTKNGNLAVNTPVSIIISLDEPPPKVLTGIVKKKLDKSCARRASETGDENPGKNFYYSLALSEKAAEELSFEVGIAVIGSQKSIQIQNNLASVDLNADGTPKFFRRCAGSEGLFFTVWMGKPLEGKRIWHSFYYLDYDTDANCDEKDWEGTEN